MPDDTEIFKHVMQKRIGNTEYWREIVIFEEGPFVFRVCPGTSVKAPRQRRPACGPTQPFGMDLFQQRSSNRAGIALSATKQK